MFRLNRVYILFLISHAILFSQTTYEPFIDDLWNLDIPITKKLDTNKNSISLPNIESQSFSITTINNENEKLHRHSISYDSKGNVLFYLREDWIGNRWKMYMQAESEYNVNNDIISYTKEFFGCCGGISKRVFTYDSSGNLILDLYNDSKRTVFTYDSSGNRIQKTNEHYNITFQRWQSSSINFFLHDDFGNMVIDSSISWDENANKWINKRRTIYTYDISGNVLSIIYQSWRNSEFRNTYRLLYKYNLDGNRETYIAEHWGDSCWVSQFRYSYIYNSNDLLLSETTESWRDSQWTLSRRSVNIYNDFGRSYTYKENWSKTQNSWIKTYSDTMVYDSKGNNTSRIIDDEFCDHMGDHCIRLFSRQLTEYNDDDRVINIVFTDSTHEQNWEKTTGKIVLSDRIDHYAVKGHILKFDYSGTTDLKDIQSTNSFHLSQNYPNPFNNKTIINYKLRIKNFVIFKIYDLTGREIKTLVNQQQSSGNYSVSFDATNLPSSVYFYRLITSSGFSQSRKMVLLK